MTERRNFLLEPTIAYCGFCPWEQPYATETEAERAKASHEHLRHNQDLPERELSGNDWQTQAIDAVRTVAARGQDFTTFDALREFGIGDPPNAKTALGKFGSLVHDLQIAHPVGYKPSSRATTKRSALAVWNRDPSRCTSPRCQSKRAAS